MTNKFKVGDKVRRIIRGASLGGIQVGDTAEITKIKPDGEVGYRWNNSSIYSCSPDLFELIDTPKNSNNKYSFRSPVSMIDADLVRAELSYKKPIAILKDPNNTGVVAIHKSILEKAKLCDYEVKDDAYVFTKETIGIIGEVKKYVQEVKRLEYPKGDPSVKITVEILEVN